MSENVEGPKGNTPSLHQQYVTEFRKSADLFEEALKNYHETSSDSPHKKAEFKKVMDQTLQVMSETAMETCRKAGQQKLEKKLEEDYQKFDQDYENKSEDAMNKDYQNLLKDIQDLRDSFQ